LPLAAQVMQRIRIAAARARASLNRGGEAVRLEHAPAVDFDEMAAPDRIKGGTLRWRMR
jgi:hypothetical protein